MLLCVQSFLIILPFIYFVVPWIHFYDSSLTTCSDYSTLPVSPGDANTVSNISNSNNRASRVPEHARNPRKDKMQPKYKFKAYDRFRFYFRAPVTKFHYSMVCTFVLYRFTVF